ncbi:MAG: M24 family metallopeptidase [Thermincolia bacterium]
MEQRIRPLRQAMAAEDIDGILVLQPENRVYLSGFTGSAGILLVTVRESFLITDFRYAEQAAQQAPDFVVVEYSGVVTDKLREVIGQAGVKRVGFEKDFITVAQFQDWQEKLIGIEVIPRQGMVEKLRMVKDEQELALIRKAVALADQTFEHIVGCLKPGVTELEVALELEFYMRRNGASGVSFDIIVASGPRGSLPHATPTSRMMEFGDMVTMDFGAIYGGYCSDLTRTVFLGEAKPKEKEIYSIVLEAQEAALAAIAPGKTANAVDQVARDIIAEKGYGDNFGHGLGHAVGLAVHEKPSLGKRDETPLVPGMVLTVEPGIYIPNWGGVRIEDMVLVTDRGCEILTQAGKGMLIV